MRLGIGVLLAALWLPLHADPQPPAISIIIDDLGGRRDLGQRVIALPGPVACALLPHRPHTRELARAAHRHGKEVLLHLPMQPVAHRRLDAGGLSLDMSRTAFAHTLQRSLEAVPHVSGVNNHMGSLLTRHPGHMLWLMQELNRHGDLFFVDSRTTTETVAMQVARENGVNSVERDVFLDHDPAPEAVRAQFERLVALARARGAAVAIGHPNPTTLAVLDDVLPTLAGRGIRLVSVAEMIALQHGRPAQWRVSLSPSRPAAKSSKPSPLSTCCAGPESK